jgi:nicotinamidase-related amidase
MASPTLRDITGMTRNPSSISNSALVLIDCQQTYREGVMKLAGVEPALEEAAALLQRFRAAKRPVIHIMHDAGPGTPYDVNAPIGQIADGRAHRRRTRHRQELTERVRKDGA